MYFRKMRPLTTCLYSAASMSLRSASAAAHSLASKLRLAVVSVFLSFVAMSLGVSGVFDVVWFPSGPRLSASLQSSASILTKPAIRSASALVRSFGTLTSVTTRPGRIGIAER